MLNEYKRGKGVIEQEMNITREIKTSFSSWLMQQFFISFSTMDISCFLKQSSPGLERSHACENCYGMFVLPPNSDGKEEELLEGDGIMRVKPLWMGLVPLKKRPQRAPLPFLPCEGSARR